MNKEERLPLSYVGQYDYCPRRAALLMNQQLWQENEYTAEGRTEHQRVHTARVERRGSLLKLYEFHVWSDQLNLSGKCDCIEAYEAETGAYLPEEQRNYALYPIEYKHGRVRKEPEYELQLCAQAMCLEEMYSTSIPEGALFYIDAHQRIAVPFTQDLRKQTLQTAQLLWQCYKTRGLPKAFYGPKCKKCSLAEECMPKLTKSAKTYCEKLLSEMQEELL